MIVVLTGEKKHSKIKKKCVSDADKCAETKAVIWMLCWLPKKGMTADPKLGLILEQSTSWLMAFHLSKN